jgi:GNAT superfamily N-acetyltransferase
MKLTIIKLAELSRQDLIDLGKIWPEQSTEQWLSWLSTTDHLLFAACFNERLLAAVKVSLSQQQGQLSDLMVRELTRRRGVGSYLLSEVQQQLPDVLSWHMEAVGNDPVLHDFMLACGFQLNVNEWLKETSK